MLALALALLASLASHGSSLAIPTPQDGGGTTPPFATNTSITYYQGPSSSMDFTLNNATCMVPVSTGTLQGDYCTRMTVSGIGIQQVEIGTCSLTLWSGSDACDGDATEKTTFPIPRGSGVTCVDVGVLDGGLRQKASVVWACG